MLFFLPQSCSSHNPQRMQSNLRPFKSGLIAYYLRVFSLLKLTLLPTCRHLCKLRKCFSLKRLTILAHLFQACPVVLDAKKGTKKLRLRLVRRVALPTLGPRSTSKHSTFITVRSIGGQQTQISLKKITVAQRPLPSKKPALARVFLLPQCLMLIQ